MKIGDIVYIVYGWTGYTNGSAYLARIIRGPYLRKMGYRSRECCRIQPLQKYNFSTGWIPDPQSNRIFSVSVDVIYLDAESALKALLKTKETDLAAQKQSIEVCKQNLNKVREDLKYCQTEYRKLKRLDVAKQFYKSDVKISASNIVTVDDGFNNDYYLDAPWTDTGRQER